MKKSNDAGFTLIELFVVLLILALLVAIAVPTFLGAKRRAQERQTPVRGGIVVKKIHEPSSDSSTTTMVGKIPVTSTTHHDESWAVRVVNCEQFDPCKTKDFGVNLEVWDAVQIGQWYGEQR